MEEVYQQISRAINIDKQRKPYTEMYDCVRYNFLKGLKEFEVFKELFCDVFLCGSYADNLKITEPNEFDVDIQLEFPFHDYVRIQPDPFNQGNIYINLNNVIELVEAQGPAKEYMKKFLRSVVDNDGYLLINKFQSWFEGCVTRFCLKNQNYLIFEKTCGHSEKLTFKYSKQGPAHTLLIEGKNKKISIDFVPVIRFGSCESLCQRIPANDFWEAVPKPINGTIYNKSFRCSFAQAEKSILKGKNHFKNTLRLMKKYRDMRPSLTNLKSYYIKTLFLWSDEEFEMGYWRRNSCLTIMDKMFERLERVLETRTLPFYWDRSLNLLSALSYHQIEPMYYEVKRTRQILLDHENLRKVLNVFLTKEEQRTMHPEVKELMEKSFLAVVADSIKENATTLIVAGLAVLGISLWQSFRNNTTDR